MTFNMELHHLVIEKVSAFLSLVYGQVLKGGA